MEYNEEKGIQPSVSGVPTSVDSTNCGLKIFGKKLHLY
jgi:hypothetical protein